MVPQAVFLMHRRGSKRKDPFNLVFCIHVGNGSTRCAPSMRNPLIEGLKDCRGSAHCKDRIKKVNPSFFYRRRNGSTRCAPSMRNPPIEGLKDCNGSAHCKDTIKKVNPSFFIVSLTLPEK